MQTVVALQSVTESLLTDDDCPAGQLMQDDEPASTEYVLIGHSKQDDEPGVSL